MISINPFKDFELKRNERVEMAFEQAQHKSAEITPDHMGTIAAYSWETFVTHCPVCKINGLLEGYTELAIGEDEDGHYPTLDFFATSFICDECGLTLHDIEELKLVNMSILYDRTGELDKWFKEHETVLNWYLDKYT